MISVGTQNLFHHNNQMTKRLEHFRKSQNEIAEIMGLQEAAQWKTTPTLYDAFSQLPHFNGLRQITNSLGIMTEGIALLSSLDSRNLKSLELPNTALFSRQFLISGYFGKDEVFVINLHLSPFPQNRFRRMDQVQFVLRFLENENPGVPTIIIGDLNDSYDSEPILLLRNQGFQDVFEGKEVTFDPGRNPLITEKKLSPSQLDYILYRPRELKLREASIIFKENWISDHYGIKATFEK